VEGATDVLWKQLQWRCGAVDTRHCVIPGFDNSSASHTALAYATGWAKRNDAGLVVVHVENMDGSRSLDTVFAAVGALPALDCAQPDVSQQVLKAMADAQTPWAYLNADGDVASQLEAVADVLQADAIIVGRSRRGLRRFRSSVCRRLVANSRRIVVIVP